jgi:hypothetical protein
LNAIPPMGDKFLRAEVASPSGARAVAQGEYHGVISFYFGKLP